MQFKSERKRAIKYQITTACSRYDSSLNPSTGSVLYIKRKGTTTHEIYLIFDYKLVKGHNALLFSFSQRGIPNLGRGWENLLTKVSSETNRIPFCQTCTGNHRSALYRIIIQHRLAKGETESGYSRTIFIQFVPLTTWMNNSFEIFRFWLFICKLVNEYKISNLFIWYISTFSLFTVIIWDC